MKARVLVVKVNDGDEYVEMSAIADENTMSENWEWLGEQVARVRKDFGNALESYGFVDIEIPDDVIVSVLRMHADAGIVTATAVEEG